MKKLFIAALFAITVISSAFAAGTNVSYSAVINFKSTFKNALNVAWTTGDGYAKASFVLKGVNMEAFFSPDGEMIGTSKAITLDDLSVAAKRAFAKKYDSYNVKEAIRFEGMEESAYYISAANENETVIVKVSDADELSIVKTTKN